MSIMTRKEAIAVLHGDGTTNHDERMHPLIDQLDAYCIYARSPGYHVQSAEADFQSRMLGTICEALVRLLKDKNNE